MLDDPNVFAVGVLCRYSAWGPTPVPCGLPENGLMIESMVTARPNIGNIVRVTSRTASAPGTRSAWRTSATGARLCVQPADPAPTSLVFLGQVGPLAKAVLRIFIRKLRKGTPSRLKPGLKVLVIDKLKKHEGYDMSIERSLAFLPG